MGPRGVDVNGVERKRAFLPAVQSLRSKSYSSRLCAVIAFPSPTKKFFPSLPFAEVCQGSLPGFTAFCVDV